MDEKLNYRWAYDPKGQYVDGHERADTVEYRQNIFLPAWRRIYSRVRDYEREAKDNQPPP